MADSAWLADLELAIQHGGPEPAWRVFQLQEAAQTTDRIVALSHCQLVQAFPLASRAKGLDAIASSFDSDVEVIVAAAAAYNALAALRPLDAEGRDSGPEHQAASLAKRGLKIEGLSEETQGYLWINLANALRAQGAEHDTKAQEAYAKALALCPDRGAWHFDLGVCHKWRGRWQQAADQFFRARARSGATKAVLWNIAIACTALGDGDLAAKAWQELGFEEARCTDSGQPVVDGIPTCRIRVRSRPAGFGVTAGPQHGFEALSIAPISPGHGIVCSPSFGECPIDYGDTVLWDGSPVSKDAQGDVFPALEILRSGTERRLRFAAIVESGELERFVQALGDHVRVFAYSDGGTAAPQSTGETLVYGKLIISEVEDHVFLSRYETAQASDLGVRMAVPELYERVGDARRAGQEHQAWRGIERVAIKRGLVVESTNEG